jgi:hypothetical protein
MSAAEPTQRGFRAYVDARRRSASSGRVTAHE